MGCATSSEDARASSSSRRMSAARGTAGLSETQGSPVLLGVTPPAATHAVSSNPFGGLEGAPPTSETTMTMTLLGCNSNSTSHVGLGAATPRSNSVRSRETLFERYRRERAEQLAAPPAAAAPAAPPVITTAPPASNDDEVDDHRSLDAIPDDDPARKDDDDDDDEAFALEAKKKVISSWRERVLSPIKPEHVHSPSPYGPRSDVSPAASPRELLDGCLPPTRSRSRSVIQLPSPRRAGAVNPTAVLQPVPPAREDFLPHAYKSARRQQQQQTPPGEGSPQRRRLGSVVAL